METNFIEKLNKSRYNSTLFVTIGIFIANSSLILNHLGTHRYMPILTVLGAVISVISVIKLIKVGKQINSNAKAREALNDELYKLYNYKSSTWGFGAVIAIAVLLIPVSWFYELSSEMACELILFNAILAYFISFLIYNRDTH